MSAPTDRFEFLDTLGAPSAHSVVMLMRDPSTGQEVAVKARRDGDTIERRFSREFTVTRAAAGHHVIPVLEVDKDGDWYSMPVADGDLTRSHGHSTDRESLALEVVEAIAHALRDFHQAGHVHRDLKPQNLLWFTDATGSRWVVADFGIARNAPGSTTSPLTVAGGLVGTEGWAPPELHSDAHTATPTADVYSVGAIVSWILTGTPPTPRRVAPVGDRFRGVVSRATRDTPARRFHTVDQMLDAMKASLAGSAGPLTSQLTALLTGPVNVPDLSNFAVAYVEKAELLLTHLPALSRADLARWAREDPEGLHHVALSLTRAIADESARGSLQREALRTPMYWSLDVLKVTLRGSGRYSAHDFAAAFFDALEATDQWSVGDKVAAWMKKLSDRDATFLLEALRSSDAEEYVRRALENDFSTSTSRVIRDWMT